MKPTNTKTSAQRLPARALHAYMNLLLRYAEQRELSDTELKKLLTLTDPPLFRRAKKAQTCEERAVTTVMTRAVYNLGYEAGRQSHGK